MSTQELKVYRRSELEAVESGCLHRYRKIWIDKVDDSSDPALIGIGFHAIKHRYVMGLVEHKLTSDAEIAQSAFVEGIATAQTPSRLVPEVRSLWMFHAEKYELDLDRFVTAEEKGITAGKAFTPDLVYATPETNELEIQDDKSGWQPPMSEEELKGLFQARFYIRYARDRWPNFSRYRFTLNAIRFNKSVSVTFLPSELDQIDLEVEAHIKTLERAHATNSWPAVAGPGCRYCELECPLMAQVGLVPKRFLAPSYAAKTAGNVLAAKAYVRAATKALKGYVAAHGPLVVNNIEWAIRPAEQKHYPIGIVLDVLKMRNVAGVFDDTTVKGLTISHSALAKLFKQFPMLEDDLSNYVITKPSNRFSAKAPGDEDSEDE